MPQGPSNILNLDLEKDGQLGSKSNSAGIKQVKAKHELNYKYNTICITNTNTCETGAMTNRM